jgi:integrase
MLTKRKTANKLNLYRRHAENCNVGPAAVTGKCECPLWVHGNLKGKFIRTSLGTRSLGEGEDKMAQMLAGAKEELDAPSPAKSRSLRTFAWTQEQFLAAKAEKASRTLVLYKRAVEHFAQWAATQRIERVSDIEQFHVVAYFRQMGVWKQRTKRSRLTHLRVFFNFCVENRWIDYSPAAGSSLSFSKKDAESMRLPFTSEEITRIVAACDRLPSGAGKKNTGAKNAQERRERIAARRARARALVLLLLYSGMRISDAAFAERDSISEEGLLDYHVIKTRKQITQPIELQTPALDALKALPASRVYFFQPDADDDYADARQALRTGKEFGEFMPRYNTRVEECMKLVRCVLKLAGLPGGCHRFRDTFAVSLLTGDVDIFTVSQMLGHSDVRITQNHYVKWIKGYREKKAIATRALAYSLPG